MSPLVTECSRSLIENLKEAADKDESIDCKMLLGAFTMDAVASCAFATKIDSHRDPNNPFVTHARQVFNVQLNLRMILLFIMPKLYQLLGLRVLKKEVNDFFCGIARRLIKERSNKKTDRVDFLQLLLDASEFKNTENKEGQEAEDSLESSFDLNEKGDDPNNIDIPNSLKKKALTEDEVLSQCFLFFVAGYETTAATLAFALYQLAVNEDCQDKLFEEIRQTLEEHGEIDYDALKKMPYLDAVVSETLRLNSPAIRLERLAEEDYILGDIGIVVPKGTILGIPVHAMHHDPEYFPDPELFNPKRFMPENKHNIIPYTYLPFGGGPRNCVALRFALMEAKICLANIVNEFKFLRCSETKVPLVYKRGTQFLQPIGLVLKVEKRHL